MWLENPNLFASLRSMNGIGMPLPSFSLPRLSIDPRVVYPPPTINNGLCIRSALESGV